MQPSSNVSLERIAFSRRLTEALEKGAGMGASPAGLARAFNLHFSGRKITVHAARKWLTGAAIPTQDKLRSLADWLDVSVDWLRFGGNEMASGKSGQVENGASLEDNFIHRYLLLPPRERDLVRHFITMMAAEKRGPGAGEIVENSLEADRTDQLNAVCATMATARENRLSEEDVRVVLAALHADDPHAMPQLLRDRLTCLGLRIFLNEFVAPVNLLVGAAWADGRIAIRHEHLYTQALENLLRTEIAAIPGRTGGTRMLLTTAPGEAHTLGLLMVEAMLALEGVNCVPMGAQLSVEEIVQAAAHFRIGIVALSFSERYPPKKTESFLHRLRRQLPEHTPIWASGAGIATVTNRPAGVTLFASSDAAVRT